MISVIIATYNRKKSLTQAIESVLKQTYQDFEIIVVDDGSTDGTEMLFQKELIDSRIKYIKLENNCGATNARNIGLENIKGDYFLVWDSDDVLYPKALETALAIHEKKPELAVFSAPARSLYKGKEVKYEDSPKGVIPKEVIICKLLPSNHKVRIAKTSTCGDIRYKAKNIDFLVNVEMSERGEWYSHPEYLADVILESDINSLTVNRKKTNLRLSKERAPYLAEYLRKYKNLLKENSKERYAGFCYGASIGFLIAGNKIESKHFIKEALNTKKKPQYFLIYFLTMIPFGLNIFKLLVKLKNKIL